MKSTINVLHVDDDPFVIERIKHALFDDPLQRFSYQGCTDIEDFIARESTLAEPSVLLIDLNFGGVSGAGVEVLRRLGRSASQRPKLVMSAAVDPDLICDALRAGATSFLAKVYDEKSLIEHLLRAVPASVQPVLGQAGNGGGVGATTAAIRQKLCGVLRSGVRSILATGESGTGKEVVAHCLRELLRPGTPFVTVNCAAIKGDLIESELFGHVRGAFTGAITAQSGLFVAADKGWIFLDEVARLSSSAQAALLRVLETGEVRPVGSAQCRIVDVRVIAATNEDLEVLVEQGQFRDDVLQRLSGYRVEVPPLRARRGEIPEIISHLLRRLWEAQGLRYEIAPAAVELLQSYDWRRSNIRELWQVMLAATVEAVGGTISVASLPVDFLRRLSDQQGRRQGLALSLAPSGSGGLEETLLPDEFPCSLPVLEERLFRRVLQRLAQRSPEIRSLGRIATALGISRDRLTRQLRGQGEVGALPLAFHHLLASPSGAGSASSGEGASPRDI